MKKQYWYNSNSNYDGPYGTIEEAMEAGIAASKPDEVIDIHQLVATSPTPKRTWRKR